MSRYAPKDATTDKAKGRANMRVAAACVAFFGSMVGMAYAAVPLYQLFCQVTGFGGTPQIAATAPADVLDRTIKVRFDANVAPGVPWDFAPKTREIEVRLGETVQIDYAATNRGTRPVWATATFNVTPEGAGAYFNKMQCFCFTETELKPGQSMDMPVVFFVDPDIINNSESARITTITLSYTFFPTGKSGNEAAVQAAIVPDETVTTATQDDGRS
ncbi:MAG: cytochrome c oxidase assembly protein [Phyllobacteriaceae bacterium]|nr:cytochrome c oxidase assembly protein [Phyllobacteriaceae bacterium]